MNRPKPLGAHRGIVLIAVLWMVAALSIIATGVTRVLQSEIRTVSAAKQTIQARAMGEAINVIVLQALASPKQKPILLVNESVMYRGQSMPVMIRPTNGLLNINSAPALLWRNTLIYICGLQPALADQLANDIVSVRSKRDEKGGQNTFEATEDLLSVPGFTYDLYAKLKRVVIVGSSGSGRINPMAAPDELLLVLADGNEAKAQQFIAARATGGAGIDTTALNAALVDNSMSQRFQIQARVPTTSGQWLNVVQTVDLTPVVQEGIPWRTIHIEHFLDTAAPSGS